MAKVQMRNVARVWCGVMPRRGGPENAGTHMRVCKECHRIKHAYWEAIALTCAQWSYRPTWTEMRDA